jgi:hypothetical protein
VLITVVTHVIFFVPPQQFYYVKEIPLQAFTGPEVSRRLRLPDFKKIGT